MNLTIVGHNGISVAGGTGMSSRYIVADPEQPMQGVLRIMGTHTEVFNGYAWEQVMPQLISIELDQDTKVLLEWAKRKMAEEDRINILAMKHPALANAILSRDKADEVVKILVALCETEKL